MSPPSASVVVADVDVEPMHMEGGCLSLFARESLDRGVSGRAARGLTVVVAIVDVVVAVFGAFLPESGEAVFDDFER